MKTNCFIFIVIFSKTMTNTFLETSDEEKGKEWYDSDIVEKDIDNNDDDSSNLDFEGN